jgi:hypothetical protein
MDLETAIAKIRAGLVWLVKANPQFTGRYQIELRFQDGKVVRLKKVALRPVL